MFTRLQAHTKLLIALAVFLVSFAPGRISAFEYTPVSGTVGTVSLPTIYVGDKAPGCAITLGGYQVCAPNLTFWGDTGPIVHRSPASAGVQTVAAKYLVERWDGGAWVIAVESAMLQGRIGANQSRVQFVRPEMIVKDVARGYFRFSWVVVWHSSTGVALGSAMITPNLATDHICVTPARWCMQYSGYVRTGGYLSNSW